MSESASGPAITRVFVRGLIVEAEIGVNADELGRQQPLIVDIEVELSGEPWRGFNQTVDYERLAGHARRLAAGGHVGLVETFAWRLARACLGEAHVSLAKVRVEKPQALAPATAGVEVVVRRD